MELSSSVWRAIFLFVFIVRYLRTIVHAWVFYFRIKSSTPIAKPSYTSLDATVVLPTILDTDITTTLRSIVKNDPYQIILVVHEDDLAKAEKIRTNVGFPRLVVLTVPQLGRRLQMVAGIIKVQTSITIFCDDDVLWHPKLLSYLLTPLEDARVGATGTNQRALRRSNTTLWSFLGACYLERRNFNTITTNYIDGAVSTLSGRTFACRTQIVQTPNFYEFLINDDFLGSRIKIGDDKRFTMRFYAKGWRISLIYTEEAVLYTSMADDARFLGQCLRWARSHWQGNAAVVMGQSYWWRRHCWSAYATYLGSLMTPAILIDGGLYYLLQHALKGETQSFRYRVIGGFIAWTLLQKTIKIWPHFARWPSDMRFIPAMILFSYAHGIINLWAAFTMTSNEWGGRDVSLE
ncbi:hypothetical protein NM208_g970 [Fusarium decemcellulare]|uniref:Uncharacterized protein n=1 Tax=Fusarium decemcellulare TaxID=57161 RepID=A0ACC1SXT5_9HYPO|nr:hypothetical protein NM208_g970 [Fusarium decemcellulare]